MSPGRVLIATAVLIGCAVMPAVQARSAESTLTFWLCAILPALLVFVTEPERLPTRSGAGVPRSFVLALLSAPLFPGGGRGALFLLLSTLGLYGSFLARRSLFADSAPAFSDEDGLQAAGACLYAIVYLLVPAGLAAPWSDRRGVRIAARAVVPTLAVAGFLVGSAPHPQWGVAGRLRDLTFANPWELLEEITRDGRITDRARLHFAILAGLGVAAVVLNVPRMLRGVAEVLGARREGSTGRAA